MSMSDESIIDEYVYLVLLLSTISISCVIVLKSVIPKNCEKVTFTPVLTLLLC